VKPSIIFDCASQGRRGRF